MVKSRKVENIRLSPCPVCGCVPPMWIVAEGTPYQAIFLGYNKACNFCGKMVSWAQNNTPKKARDYWEWEVDIRLKYARAVGAVGGGESGEKSR